jgi:RNA polymerase sigma-70 factor (ECF subfamily)
MRACRRPTCDPEWRGVRDSVEESDAIAARLRAGDPAALAELFERDGSQAYRLAYRVLQDGAAAEDAVQEAFAQLWERAPNLNGTGNIRSLLMTIVHRRALDQIRTRQRRIRLVTESDALLRIDEEAADLLDRVIEQVSSEGLRQRLRAALDGLPAEQRSVVELGHAGGLTLSEIAARENVPLGTVKSRLRLAMQKLSHALNEGGEKDRLKP